MHGSLDVRRSLALTGAFVLATWGAAALPAQAADPGTGEAKQEAKHEAKDKAKDKNNKDDGAKDKDTKDKGDKSNNGNGPKDKGDKGDKGKGDKGDKGDPAGNNGTVKITPHGEVDGIPQNSPHPGCVFDIEWYGFDEGADIISTVVFESHAPTADVVLSGTDPAEVFVGGDPATGAGTETGFDGERDYTLGFEGEAHPKQGYHVKLTIHTPGSQGADTKHKVFWVEPCVDESIAGTTDEEDTTEQDATGGTATDDEDTEVLGAQASTGDDTEVMGAQASAPAAANAASDVPNAVDAGDEGNPVVDFITSPLPLLVLGLGAVLGAAALVSRRRATANG